MCSEKPTAGMLARVAEHLPTCWKVSRFEAKTHIESAEGEKNV